MSDDVIDIDARIAHRAAQDDPPPITLSLLVPSTGNGLLSNLPALRRMYTEWKDGFTR